MAFEPSFKYYFINPDTGYYFYATQNQLAFDTWDIFTTPTPTPLLELPKGWDNLTIEWTRNNKWMGVFRTQTTTFQFVKDARAILKTLLFGGVIDSVTFTGVTGVQAKCVLQIDAILQADWTYETVYTSNINFSQSDDDVQNAIFSAPTLDSNLREKLDAYSGTQFNIPYWETYWDGSEWRWRLNTQDYGSGLAVNPVIGIAQGIKLLYQQRFTTGATASVPLNFNVPLVSIGKHLEFSLTQLNLIQANGTPTIVGNHLLENTFILGTQQYRNAGTFEAFSRNSYCYWNLTGSDITLIFTPQFQFDFTYQNPDPASSTYPHKINFFAWNIKQLSDGTSVLDTATIFAEIDLYNNPTFGIGDTIPITGYNFENQTKTDIPNQDTTPSFNPYIVFGLQSLPVTIKNNDMVVIGIQGDCPDDTILPSFTAYDLDFYTFSQPAIQGIAVQPSPSLPPSPFIGYRPLDILKALTQNLFTTATDANGFPTTLVDYAGQYGYSLFLGNNSLSDSYNFDNIPYNTVLTSGNSLRDIRGISYLTTSLDTFFKNCKNIWACGLGIENDGTHDFIRVEGLNYFFDNATMILDLGTDVYGLSIKPMTDYLGNNLKTGFQQRQANQDYGMDSFCVEQDYTLPITRIKNDIDLTIPDNVDEYQIETARAEQNSKDQSSANSDNQTYIIALDSSATQSATVYRPDNSTLSVTDAQNNWQVGGSVQNVTFSTPPYVNGLLFPDTAMNLGLSPARCVLRNGAFLRSILDGLDNYNITFRKQYQLLFNQVNSSYQPVLYPSVSSNLSGTLINEAGDIAINTLYSSWGKPTEIQKLFRPYIMEITTKQPLNMFSIMNSSPYGYVQFTINSVVYQGFIWNVSQKIGNQSAVTFTLLAVPDQVF